MGMFDTIKVPVSYLRNVLDKKDEKYFDNDTDFQTKDLDCIMGEYKIYRRQLFRRKFLRDEFETKVDTEWIKEDYTGDVNFYTLIRDEEETEYIFDFKFSFKNGKLDTKDLLRKEYLASKEEREDQDRMYDIEQSFLDEIRAVVDKYKAILSARITAFKSAIRVAWANLTKKPAPKAEPKAKKKAKKSG